MLDKPAPEGVQEYSTNDSMIGISSPMGSLNQTVHTVTILTPTSSATLYPIADCPEDKL
jgi:hypothetical protein